MIDSFRTGIYTLKKETDYLVSLQNVSRFFPSISFPPFAGWMSDICIKRPLGELSDQPDPFSTWEKGSNRTFLNSPSPLNIKNREGDRGGEVTE